MTQPREHTAVTSGRMMLVAAAVLWSTGGLIVKSPPLEQIEISVRGPVLACQRALFAAAILLPFVDFRRIRWRAGLVPLVLSFAVMNLLFITAITRTTSAAAIFLQYTSTVWAFLFGWLLLREPPQRANLVTLGFVLCGIVWLVAGDWGGVYFVGNLMALGSGLTYGGVIVCLRHLRNEDSAWLICVCQIASWLVLLPWVSALEVSLSPVQWSLAAALGVVQLATPYLLFARAVRSVSAQEAALIPLLEPILNPIWVWVFWREAIPAATLAGGALILLGLLLRYTLLRPPRSPVVDRS